ncbi:MAG: endonuclease/exonuclease/phosphatase family protein, partial [Prevotella sp.]|nr:endonuclease/exonuclease/phosphatase family protein [Prevotella sp.]
MKKATTNILLAANIIIVAMMLATGFAGYLNPATFTYLQLSGFAFPAFLAANAAFVAVWLFVDWKRVYVPALGFLLAYSPVMTYFPVNTYKDVPEDALKVLSFNVYAFNTDDAPEGEPNPILEYITQSEADIVCIQEFTHIVGQDSLWHEMERIYQYNDTLKGDSAGSVTVAMYSKYPIKAKEKLHIRSSKNAAGVFTVEMDGRQVKVINAHLETVGFTNEDKSKFSQIVHGNADRRE